MDSLAFCYINHSKATCRQAHEVRLPLILARGCGRRVQKAACKPTFRLRPGSGAFGNTVVVSTDVAL